MRNYARFCKLNIENKKYQLNLTEMGGDDAHFFNKLISVVALSSPAFIIYKIAEMFYGVSVLGVFNIDLISQIIAATIVAFGFVIPFFESGKGYNAILRSLILKSQLKKYYKKMRSFENKKTNLNCKTINNSQKNLTQNFLKKLNKITKRNAKIQKKYNKIIKKKGFVDGLHAFVNDNIESLQEAVDKFVFHNKEILLKLCPEQKNFINERFIKRFEIIKNEGNYYDEFIWSASHSKDNLIKNNCINKGETSDYLERLKELFNLQDLSVEDDKIKSYKLKIKNNKYLNKNTNKIVYNENIYTETAEYLRTK